MKIVAIKNYQDLNNGNVMGVKGIYATDSLDFGLNYAVNFTKKEVNNGSYPILFIFKLNVSKKEEEKIKIGMINHRMMGKNYEEEFDNDYDIILLNERFFQSNAIQIKFTERFFEKYNMELIKILNFGDFNYDYIYFENSKKYKLPEQKIFDIKNIYLLFKYANNSKYKTKDIEEIKLIVNNMNIDKLNMEINKILNDNEQNQEGGNKKDYYLKYVKYLNKIKFM
jgi:hypothetical protein